MSWGETLASTLANEVFTSSVKSRRAGRERRKRGELSSPEAGRPSFSLRALEKMKRREERKEKQNSFLSSAPFAFPATSEARVKAPDMLLRERREERVWAASFSSSPPSLELEEERK